MTELVHGTTGHVWICGIHGVMLNVVGSKRGTIVPLSFQLDTQCACHSAERLFSQLVGSLVSDRMNINQLS